MKELRRMQWEEEEEEERKIEEYCEIGLRLKEFFEEDLRKVRKFVFSFIIVVEEVEEVKYLKKLIEIVSSQQLDFIFDWIIRIILLQRIEEVVEKGELDEFVFMIIWNCFDFVRRDVRRYIYFLLFVF